MSYLLRTACVSSLLTLAAAYGAWWVAHDHTQTHAVSSLRAQDIEDERSKWQHTQLPVTSPHVHAAHTGEALRTLSLLESLYDKEQALWTYYDAIEQRKQTQDTQTAERALLEQAVHHRQQELSRLSSDIQRLRPLSAHSTTAIRFR